MVSFLKNLHLEIRCLVEEDAYFDCEMFNWFAYLRPGVAVNNYYPEKSTPSNYFSGNHYSPSTYLLVTKNGSS